MNTQQHIDAAALDARDGVYTDRRGNMRVFQFDSLAAILGYVAAPIDDLGYSHNAQIQREFSRSSADWTFGALKSKAGYMQALRQGWPDAVKRIDAIAASIAANVAAPVDLRRRPRRGAQGDAFDIHTARAGKLDRAWERRDRAFTKARAPLRILVDCTANANVTEEAFFWRGAAAIALARPLIAKGYKVAITALLGTRGTYRGGAGFLAAVNIKGYGEMLDEARIASVICSPATLRYLGFRTLVRAEEHVTSCGMGHAMYNDAIMFEAVKAGLFGVRVEERMLIADLWNESKAREWITKTSAGFAA